MNAGRSLGAMRAYVTLLAPQDVPDEIGGVTRSYVAAGSLWAEIAPLTGSDRFIAQRMEQTITHRIRFRYRTDVTGAHRIALGARLFVIHAVVDPDERTRFLECRCEEIKA